MGLVKGMVTLQGGAIVRKHLLAQAIEGNALEKSGRNDPVSIDVIAPKGNPRARNLLYLRHQYASFCVTLLYELYSPGMAMSCILREWRFP